MRANCQYRDKSALQTGLGWTQHVRQSSAQAPQVHFIMVWSHTQMHTMGSPHLYWHLGSPGNLHQIKGCLFTWRVFSA